MSTLKPTYFPAVLGENLDALGISNSVPVLIYGMAGTAQGWFEAPYVDLPVNLNELPMCAVRVPD